MENKIFSRKESLNNYIFLEEMEKINKRLYNEKILNFVGCVGEFF